MVRRSKAAAFLKTGTLIFVSAIVAVGLAEMLIRVFSPQPVGRALPMYEPDPVLLHRLRPGYEGRLRSSEFDVTVAVNSLGFRGGEWSMKPGSRVVVLGDSFTFGYGVPEHAVFTALLQDSLRRDHYDVTVYNAGVPGYGTTQELRLLEHLWAVVEPHVVILAFTVGSDLRNEVEQHVHDAPGYEVKRGYLVPTGMPVGRSLPLKALFQERSHLYVLLQKTRARISLSGTDRSQPALGCDHFLAREPCGDVAVAWRLVSEALREMKSQCDDHGAEPVLLSIPHPVQIYDDLWEREVRHLKSTGDALVRLSVQTRLRVLADSLGVPMIDPVSAFRGCSGEQLYFSLDRHLTESGHEIIASKLLQVMPRIIKGRREEVVDRLRILDTKW